MPGPSRGYVFTMWSPDAFWLVWDSDPIWEDIAGDPLRKLLIQYICYQMEVCPTSDRSHAQGFVFFVHPIRLTQAKRVLGASDTHLDRQRGTHAEAIDYTRKEETRSGIWFEHGVAPVGQGGRTDLSLVSQAIRGGSTLRSIVLDYTSTFIRYPRGVERAINIVRDAPARPNIRILVLHGVTGSGKSQWVFENFRHIYKWPISQNGAYYAAGYTDQRVCLFDEFGRSHFPLDVLLSICDRYPLYVNTLGSVAAFCADTIIFTSNSAPSTWYRDELGAFSRRLADFGTVVQFPIDMDAEVQLSALFGPREVSGSEPVLQTPPYVPGGLISNSPPIEDTVSDLLVGLVPDM